MAPLPVNWLLLLLADGLAAAHFRRTTSSPERLLSPTSVRRVSRQLHMSDAIGASYIVDSESVDDIWSPSIKSGEYEDERVDGDDGFS